MSVITNSFPVVAGPITTVLILGDWKIASTSISDMGVESEIAIGICNLDKKFEGFRCLPVEKVYSRPFVQQCYCPMRLIDGCTPSVLIMCL